MRKIAIGLLLLLVSIATDALANETAAPDTRHVVVVVFDGMRPDLVNERNTPALWKLARNGVTFRRHHSIYPTSTDVNGAAMATGAFPSRNGLLANREYRPRMDPQRAFENAEPDVIRKGDEISDGKYLSLQAIAEIVQAAGLRTAITGTKAVAFLQDRHAEWTSAVSKNSITRFAAAPMPAGTRETLERLLGPFTTEPPTTNDQRNEYATKTLTDVLWRDEVPAYSLLWLSDPDLTQHEYSPGEERSMSAIRNSDRHLAAVLDALGKKGVRETTDVFVVSDHGFSTIERSIDFPAVLRAAGFDATDRFEGAPKAGQVMVVGNGGTILFYVIDHDPSVVSRLIEFLQHSDFAGVIFAREKFDGVFPLAAVHLDSDDAADVVVALRWDSKRNRFGIPGQIMTDAVRPAGQGSHASLSRFDVHNLLIAAGPGFRRGMLNDLPSSNIDLAPTILSLLRLESPHTFDGRVLTEAMKGKTASAKAATEKVEVTRKFSSGEWRQYLQVTRVGETKYVDEGNGAFEP